MKLKRFLIPSLVAAGLFPQQASAIPMEDKKPEDTGKTSLFQAFKLQHVFTLAGHRSHSSHASHSSHRSSSGGSVYRAPTYTAPTPRYTSPAPSYTPAPASTYSAPAPSVSSPSFTTPAAPAPLYTPPVSDSTSPSSILPSSPDAALKVLPGNSDKFLEIAKQVQLGLYSWGYYAGAIDGIVGPETRLAISSMQADWGLSVTGTITPEVLNALKIVAQ
jgi:His-Xaa-Ser repeat protein HxsA